jgi:hypothetical protein
VRPFPDGFWRATALALQPTALRSATFVTAPSPPERVPIAEYDYKRSTLFCVGACSMPVGDTPAHAVSWRLRPPQKGATIQRHR